MNTILNISPNFLLLFGEVGLYFWIGIVESFLADLNILFLNKKHYSGCFITSVLNTIVFYMVIVNIMKNDQSVLLIVANSFGIGAGEILALIFYDYLNKVAKKFGKKLKKLGRTYFVKKIKSL